MSGHDEYACELLRRADLAEIARLRAEVETLREERDRYDSAQMCRRGGE